MIALLRNNETRRDVVLASVWQTLPNKGCLTLLGKPQALLSEGSPGCLGASSTIARYGGIVCAN